MSTDVLNEDAGHTLKYATPVKYFTSTQTTTVDNQVEHIIFSFVQLFFTVLKQFIVNL